jgi:hypothetical protein
MKFGIAGVTVIGASLIQTAAFAQADAPPPSVTVTASPAAPAKTPSASSVLTSSVAVATQWSGRADGDDHEVIPTAPRTDAFGSGSTDEQSNFAARSEATTVK